MNWNSNQISSLDCCFGCVAVFIKMRHLAGCYWDTWNSYQFSVVIVTLNCLFKAVLLNGCMHYRCSSLVIYYVIVEAIYIRTINFEV